MTIQRKGTLADAEAQWAQMEDELLADIEALQNAQVALENLMPARTEYGSEWKKAISVLYQAEQACTASLASHRSEVQKERDYRARMGQNSDRRPIVAKSGAHAFYRN